MSNSSPCQDRPTRISPSAGWDSVRQHRALRGTCAVRTAPAHPQRGAAAAGPPRPAQPTGGRGLGEPARHSAAAPHSDWPAALSVFGGTAPTPCCHGAVRGWGRSRRRCCRRRGSPGGERLPGLAMATSTTGSTLLQPLSNAVRLPVDQVRMGRCPPRRRSRGLAGEGPHRAPAPHRPALPRPPAAPPSIRGAGAGRAAPGAGGGRCSPPHPRAGGRRGGGRASRAGASSPRPSWLVPHPALIHPCPARPCLAPTCWHRQSPRCGSAAGNGAGISSRDGKVG